MCHSVLVADQLPKDHGNIFCFLACLAFEVGRAITELASGPSMQTAHTRGDMDVRILSGFIFRKSLFGSSLPFFVLLSASFGVLINFHQYRAGYWSPDAEPSNMVRAACLHPDNEWVFFAPEGRSILFLVDVAFQVRAGAKPRSKLGLARSFVLTASMECEVVFRMPASVAISARNSTLKYLSSQLQTLCCPPTNIFCK